MRTSVDAGTFSETAESNRVWWTPEDDIAPEYEEQMFDVDASDNPLAQKYNIGKTTRRGDFFVFKAATDAQGNEYSIKAVDCNMAQMLGQSIDELAKEIELFNLCSSENILTAIEVARDDSTLCMALENVGGATLNTQLARGGENYTEADARRLAGQCLNAVVALHKVGVIHRDLTPDNFLFTSKTDIESVKLCDFTFATTQKAPISDAPGGDPEFQAPEIAREDKYGPRVDIWSIGCLAHMLLTGAPPIHDHNATRLRMKLGKGDLTIIENDERWPSSASKEAADFVRALLSFGASERPDANDAAKMAWLNATGGQVLPKFKESLNAWNLDR